MENGVFVLDGVLFDPKGTGGKVADLRSAPRLPGAHNWQNAAAAYAAARALGFLPADVTEALLSFPGLAHRMEWLGEIGGITYVNDSKATNAEAAARALASYDSVYWIAGGRAKQGGIASLAPYFPRLRKAYLIGEAADDFAAALDGHAAYDLSGDLTTAVARATADARVDGSENAVVLLSPACASFDQFPDFEARGDAFRALVDGLREAAP
jgi:UDP-N-acetylmuramoylalanine--D-glutamate ligase